MSRRRSPAESAALFPESDALKPLAERMRPRSLDEIVGQDRLLGPGTALLSRCRVHVMDAVGPHAIVVALKRTLADDARGLGALHLQVDDEALSLMAKAADGDVRRALTFLEIAAELAHENRIDESTLQQVLADRTRRFDKGGEQFYDQISALHKSVRSSDPDAALYWLVRMLDGGCEPLYLARRMVRMAVED